MKTLKSVLGPVIFPALMVGLLLNGALPLLSQADMFTAYADPPDDDGFDDDLDDDFDDDFEDALLSDDTFESLISLDEIDALDGFDNFTDNVGNFALSGEILLFLDNADLAAISSRGYKIRSQEFLGGLDKNLVKIEPPVSYTIDQVKSDIQTFAPETQVDYNHIFRTESGDKRVRKSGHIPNVIFDPILPKSEAEIKIGMIDTALRSSHSVFDQASIVEKDFVSFDFKKPTHGTSIASILVGQSKDYTGLLPDATLYSASVFFDAPLGQESATTESLIQAINWLVENDVKIINMSLAGPANDILEQTITEATAKGVLIIAAVGNSGPSAKPLYPAAYENVVAVTAVDEKQEIYRRANRGEHVDFAAPGVRIRNARGRKKFQTSTGTSYATPFVAAIFASHVQTSAEAQTALIERYRSTATDLGEEGYDDTYGYGLIKP